MSLRSPLRLLALFGVLALSGAASAQYVELSERFDVPAGAISAANAACASKYWCDGIHIHAFDIVENSVWTLDDVFADAVYAAVGQSYYGGFDTGSSRSALQTQLTGYGASTVLATLETYAGATSTLVGRDYWRYQAYDQFGGDLYVLLFNNSQMIITVEFEWHWE